MPNLKQTPRIDPICYSSKIRVKANGYSEHTKMCWVLTFSCNLCDKTVKEALYLKGQMKKFHADKDQTTQESAYEDTKGRSSKDSQDYDLAKQKSYDEDLNKDS